jgi:MFS family permease
MVNSMGAFVYPFLTIYLTKTLSLDEGEAGFIVMLAITAHLPGLIVGGRLADWLGRKKILLFFQGMAYRFNQSKQPKGCLLSFVFR